MFIGNVIHYFILDHYKYYFTYKDNTFYRFLCSANHGIW